MFEITKENEELFDELKFAERIPPDAVYDFTFEDRFLVFHHVATHENHYIAYDTTTGKGSLICRKKTPYKNTQYGLLLKPLLFSIKYTGDHRYLDSFRTNPEEVIDSIFRVILPEYGYAIREQQIALSKAMFRGLTRNMAAICEAEVGTGKTMAYLVAGFVAKQSGAYREMPVTVTTSSIELQKAIMEKEIPELSRILMDYGLIDKPLTAILRKGKEHYFCKARFENYIKSLKHHPAKYEKKLKWYEDHNFEEKAMDLDRINIPALTKTKFCVSGQCTQCRYKENCSYRDYMRYAGRECYFDFQITNHNLYLADAKLESFSNGHVLLPSTYVIIDEAHKLYEAARNTFGYQLFCEEIPEYLLEVKTQCGHNVDREKYRNMLTEAQKANENFFSAFSEKIVSKDDDDRIHIMTPDEKMMATACHLSELIKEIEHSRKKIDSKGSMKATMLTKALLSFAEPSMMDTWVEVDENGKLTVCSCAKKLGYVLYKSVWSRNRSHVLTSGTIGDGKDFNYFKQEIGLNNAPDMMITEIHTASPFDYASNTRCYIAEDLPFPTNENREEYFRDVSDRIEKLIRAANGHTAVLFTSYRALRAVYDTLSARLTEYPLFCMTKSNKSAISDFKKSKNGVLFASGSMWEGVDVVGDTLSSLIIVRLPFPMVSSFSEMKKEECETIQDFIQTYAIPEMMIKLRQGIGRLIRSEEDTGVISILDSRAVYRYEDEIRHAVSKYPRVNSIREIKDFLKEVKSESFFEN